MWNRAPPSLNSWPLLDTSTAAMLAARAGVWHCSCDAEMAVALAMRSVPNRHSSVELPSRPGAIGPLWTTAPQSFDGILAKQSARFFCLEQEVASFLDTSGIVV